MGFFFFFAFYWCLWNKRGKSQQWSCHLWPEVHHRVHDVAGPGKQQGPTTRLGQTWVSVSGRGLPHGRGHFCSQESEVIGSFSRLALDSEIREGLVSQSGGSWCSMDQRREGFSVAPKLIWSWAIGQQVLGAGRVRCWVYRYRLGVWAAGRRAGPDLSSRQPAEHLVDTTNGRKKSQKNKGAAFSH